MSVKFSNGINLQNQRIINVGDASGATDAVTLQQLQNYINGLAFKEEVRVATTANGTLATAFANAQTVDGITLATGDRILIKNQTTQTENGIYVVAASGAPTRATDADSATDLNQATVRVLAGTTNGNSQWTQTTISPTVGSSNIVWAASGSGGTTYSAGNGLTLASTTFSVNAGTGIIADGTSTRIDPTYTGLAKRFAANIGDGSTTAIAVTHSLGTRDVHVAIYDATTFEVVYADIVYTSTTVVTITFATAPASSAYRVVVLA